MAGMNVVGQLANVGSCHSHTGPREGGNPSIEALGRMRTHTSWPGWTGGSSDLCGSGSLLAIETSFVESTILM